jgi:prolipoprotein diacylglyceryltransferase
MAAATAIGVLTGNTLLLLAAIALEAPWMQAIGRGRCLVQGCCHGKPTNEKIGIRYRHSRSRVCCLADLKEVPLHPTPLYSILANVVIGVFLLRLWSLGASLSLVAGVYLILAGIARFVEEAYRGEPQTALVGGLRLYQWLAIVSFALGIGITTLPSGVAVGLPTTFEPRTLIAALMFGAATGFAMGVDFPRSARRFARLAPP